jgi:phosphohistidine phosphatase
MSAKHELYLIRHGIAEERGDAWPDDAKRPLTERGTNRLRQSVRGIVKLGVLLDVILTSPLVRARQTADVVAAEFDGRPPIVQIDSLAPGGSYQAVLSDLAKQSRRRRIALVGHEPDLGALAGRLSSSHALEFKKGGVCRIDVTALPPSGPGAIRWLLTPRIMRKMGRG